jgi:chaperone required for assembly of F1-ATPase
MSGEDGKRPGQEPKRPLPKRFYKDVSVEPDGAGFRVLLDGRPVRTPRKHVLMAPTHALAEAVAEEWRAQGDLIDPGSMPLTRHVNTVLDGIAGREGEVRADIVKYAGTDLLCYRAESPEALVKRQAKLWDPVLAWARADLGAAFVCAHGVVAVSQSEAALARIGDAVAGLDAFRLSALHTMTTLTGSALLALAVQRGRLSAAEAWAAAHVDEDWQIAQWGEDAEAAARRKRRWEEMSVAERLLQLLAKP